MHRRDCLEGVITELKKSVSQSLKTWVNAFQNMIDNRVFSYLSPWFKVISSTDGWNAWSVLHPATWQWHRMAICRSLQMIDAVSEARPYVTLVMFFKAVSSLFLKVLKLFQ